MHERGSGRHVAGTAQAPDQPADWERTFRAVFDRAVAAGRAGCRTPNTMFDEADVRFLRAIGCSAQELFDFVDDFLSDGEPDFDTILAITRIRRDYFLDEMKGRPSNRVGSMDELPPKTAAVEGIEWLPRIIAKARLKLRGEMPPDLMFGCAGDRAFCRRVGMPVPQFLALVRNSGADDSRIIRAVKESARRQE
ncbi:MAG TPA: DUF5069 domain-containing protein [Methylomirabilota bacterium]|nr:DUF5069 domain-containing protein [Methylomirabilota bacterium]